MKSLWAGCSWTTTAPATLSWTAFPHPPCACGKEHSGNHGCIAVENGTHPERGHPLNHGGVSFKNFTTPGGQGFPTGGGLVSP
jgi:hypothetical protein